MAISKKRKNELVDQYVRWLNQSQAFYITSYTGLTMKQIDDLRAKARSAGGEFHILKNTLAKVAFDRVGLEFSEKLFEGSTAVAFAFQDVPELAKVIAEFNRTTEAVNIKGGFLEKQMISVDGVRSLAELPPLPVLRAQLLGTLLAPAGKLVRTLAEPARRMAAVLKAYSEKDAAPTAA